MSACARCGRTFRELCGFYPAVVERVTRSVQGAPYELLCYECRERAQTIPAAWLQLETGAAIARTRAAALFGEDRHEP